LFFANILGAQIWKGSGFIYTSSLPVHNPGDRGAWVAIDTMSGNWYEWTGSNWIGAGFRVQQTNTFGVPSYTPGGQRSRMAINSGDSLYFYQSGSWALLNDVPDLSEYVQYFDSTVVFVTPNQLSDSLSAFSGGGGDVKGSGTVGRVARWAAVDSLASGVIRDNGTTIGVNTDQQANTTMVVRGSGTTSATTSLRVEDSAGNELFSQRDDGVLFSANKRIDVNNATQSVGIGFQALLNEDQSLQSQNTAFGRSSLMSLLTGDRNTAIGNQALRDLTTGRRNIAFGHQALSMSNGNDNTAFGYQAVSKLTTGLRNIGFGFQSLRELTTGNDNIGIGFQSLPNIVTSSTNTGIGRESGMFIQSGSPLTSASSSIFIGQSTRAADNNQTNQIVIGHTAIGKGSNTAVIGNSSVTQLWLAGEVGWFQGNGTPEGVVTAPVGSFYSRKDGGAGTTFYVKESGTGNTGWVAK
jgi:hypothetical protein